MQKIEFNGYKLDMFDSAQELKIKRFQLYNLNVMLDAGIGSDLNAFNDRINSIRGFIPKKPELAMIELNNLQQSVYFIVKNASPKMASFVAMIYKIDGRELTDHDLTDQGIADILEDLNRKGLTMGIVERFLSAVKKNLDRELETFFPKTFNGSNVKEFYSKLKRRTLLILQAMQTALDISDQIAVIDDLLMMMFKPKNFHGPQGLEVQTIKSFEETCILLMQRGVDSPKEMTTLAFFQALESFKEQHKREQQGRKNNRR